MPKIYRSTATILPSSEKQGFSPLLAVGGALGLEQIAGSPLPSLTPNRDLLVSVLKSRTIAQDIVERFNLKERYRARYLSDAIKRVQGATDISISKEGAISVSVEDTDPRLAADIANFYFEDLDRLLVRLVTGAAGRQRAFVADQLAKTERALREAEDALRRFQERNRTVVLDQQARGVIEEMARLKGEIMASEVQLEVMRNFATEMNPEVVNLKKRVSEMKRQLAQIQYGKGWELPSESRNPGEPRKEIHLPVAKVPEVGLELARLTRDVKVQETVYNLLTQQLEQAKIAEARDTPTVQILDRAVPAERKWKPRIRSNMTLAGAVSLFMGIFLAFFLEYLSGLRKRLPLGE
jgi:capsule polysaccharide export protein KpsE/RkpR